jgi:hypothetical protein
MFTGGSDCMKHCAKTRSFDVELSILVKPILFNKASFLPAENADSVSGRAFLADDPCTKRSASESIGTFHWRPLLARWPARDPNLAFSRRG